MEILYNRSNQVLVDNDQYYDLFSYRTLVLRIVKRTNQILIDARAKSRTNYHGIQSVTTSKHITQALDYLGLDL